MSSKAWSNYGYGYPLFEDFDKVKNFVITNGEYDEETKTAMKECEDEIDLMEYTNDPVAWIVAKIINKKESFDWIIGYDSNSDTDQEAMLGFEPRYPWTMIDKKLPTLDEVNAILAKYAKELGITAKPDYFTAYYCG